ncbi:MAG: hypothetical protein MUO85_01150 [candidate division Zixibacteria bacterium]|nr:hypothetical protein [candidate division Zixibacteria bacterium]
MIRFKQEKLEQEFNRIDPRLRAVVFGMEFLIEKEFGKEIMITSIERTQEEQNEIYKDQIEKGYFVTVDGVKFYSCDKLKPTLSLHQLKPTRAIDLRSQLYTHEEILKIKEYIDYWFPYDNKSSLIFHNKSGEHLHLQIGTHRMPVIPAPAFAGTGSAGIQS